MRKNLSILSVFITGILLAACHRVPGHVIEPDDMAELMADIRLADAVVKLRPAEYRRDSSKYILREALFERHGVTAAQFDTSLVWYGHHLDRYQEVNDMTIKILEARQRDLASITSEAAMSVSGDSVDVWAAPIAYKINSASPSEFITFSIPADQNSEKGDSYTWRLKFITNPEYASWRIAATYTDGSVEVLHANLPSTEVQRREVTFQTDTALTLEHIGGWITLTPDAHRPVIVDSISLIRRRITPGHFSRPYNQRRIHSTQ